ncbi:MAG: hypothetical protein Q9214_000558 [Letrouitia sp. 1 TL-2023]
MAPSSNSSSQSRRLVPNNADWDMSFDMNDPDISQSSTPPSAILGRNGPVLRHSAEKYRPGFPRPPRDTSAEINLSTMANAFPDFSQNYEQSTLTNRDGARNPSHSSTTKSRGSRMASQSSAGYEEEDTFNRIPVYLDGNRVRYSPAMARRQSNSQKENSIQNAHNAQLRQSSAMSHAEKSSVTASASHNSHTSRTKAVPKYKASQPPTAEETARSGSTESVRVIGGKRQSLAHMHARAGNETNDSRLSEERPPTLDLTARNTRFSSITVPKTRKQGNQTKPNLSHGSEGSKDMGKSNTKPKVQSSYKTFPSPAPGISQPTVTISKVPAVNELLSGVYEDGTPIFHSSSKSRASRFVTGSAYQEQTNEDVDELDVPHNEKELLLSISLLQDKVAGLEKGQAKSENVIRDLQLQKHTLESEKAQIRRRQRSDSALGTEDDGSDSGDGLSVAHRKLLVERNRLESQVWGFEKQLEKLQRDAATAETTIKNISSERDNAVSQLGVAYFTMEGLKASNQVLSEENKDLKALIAHLTKTAAVSNLNGGHSLVAIDGSSDEKRHSDLKNAPQVSEAVNKVNLPRLKKEATQMRSTSGSKATTIDAAKQVEDGPNPTDNDSSVLSHYSSESVSDTGSVRRHNIFKNGPANVSKKGREAATSQDDGSDCSSNDLTYLSFDGDESIQKVRKSLEQERVARKERQLKKTNPTLQPSRDMNLPNHEPSATSNGSNRHALHRDELTSAFIIPDITIRQPVNQVKSVTDAELHMPSRNSNIEPLEIPESLPAQDDTKSTRRIKVQKPIPVSERNLDIAPYEEEPTLRPSQPPAVALAKVLRGLEDELAQVKLKLSKYQAMYNKAESAISRRQRKQIHAKIQSLVQEVDVKSDHIYNLYDVLEGQKENGQEMSQEELELTLSSIGLDLSSVELDGSNEPEAAWEGIESTTS